MPTISMDELRQMAGYDETVSVPFQPKKKTRTKEAVGQVKKFQDHRSRTETQQLIKTMLKEAGRACTFREIAYALDRSASPHLRALIIRMVDDGELVETIDMHPNQRVTRSWFSLP